MDEKIKEIDNFMTKQGKRILLIIYDAASICSSELAIRLNIRRNSMSNALERLKKAPFDLLSVKRQGRQKVYSLTNLGKEYVNLMLDQVDIRAELLNGTEEKRDTSGSTDEKGLYQNAIECIKELEEEEADWQNELVYILEKDNGEKTDLYIKLNELLNVLVKLKKENDSTLYHESLKKIDDSNAAKYIDDVVTRKNNLSILWDILAENWEKGYEIIKTFFGITNFWVEGKSIKRLYRIADKKEIWNLIQAMQEVISFAVEKKMSEEEFKDLLIKEGAEHDQYLEYLGIRYHELCSDK